MINSLSDLDTLIAQGTALVFIETLEDARILHHVGGFARERKTPLFIWNATGALTCSIPLEQPPQTKGIQEALAYVKKEVQAGLVVILDPQPHLKDPAVLRLLIDLAQNTQGTSRTVMLVGDHLQLPDHLRRVGKYFTPPFPDSELIREIYYEEVYRWLWEDRGRKFMKPGDMEDKLVRHLAGLNEEDVRRLMAESIRDDGRLTLIDLKRILNFKRENSGKDGLIEFGIETQGLDLVGGLNHLKHWLELRRATFTG
jgi:hypothetical protein